MNKVDELAKIIETGLAEGGALYDIDFAALKNAREALAELVSLANPKDGWCDIGMGQPPHGEPFLAVVDGRVRVVQWGKTSHVPMYGYCLADQGVEDFDLCHPTHWRPMPRPPTPQRSEG